MTITITLVLLALIGLSAMQQVRSGQPAERSDLQNGSSYHAGPTGTRAFYQLLEESGRPVGRWRESWEELEKRAAGAILVVIGPLDAGQSPVTDETAALARWIDNGGQLIVIGATTSVRLPGAELRTSPSNSGGASSGSSSSGSPPQNEADARPGRETSRGLITQPTRLTRDIAQVVGGQPAGRIQLTARSGSVTDETVLSGGIVHLGDENGAILVDFEFGSGRAIFLSDPFIVSNQGITAGDNLELALNLVDELTGEESGRPRRIFFDEYHHGFGEDGRPLLAWLRGTPWPLIGLQGLLVALLILHGASRRFIRPLPLDRLDRHSALEYVGSMANLQRLAAARDLAIENIGPGSRLRICRHLGLFGKTDTAAIIARLVRLKGERLSLTPAIIERTLTTCEEVTGGKAIGDGELVELVRNLRRIEADLRRLAPR